MIALKTICVNVEAQICPCFVISTYSDHQMVAVSSSEVGFMVLTLELIQLPRVRLYQPDFQWLNFVV